MIDKAPAGILIGTSGFSYTDWKGVFYPEKISSQAMLAQYATVFDTVEINSTYYAIPRPQSMETMVNKTKGKLDFVVKANQDITHRRDKVHQSLPQFKEALAPLQNHGVLGCVLLQFPFSFHLTAKNRAYLLEIKQKMGLIPIVVEFRNHEWIRDQTFQMLRENEIGFCCVDEPRLPGLLPPIVSAPTSIGYVRFHGRNEEKWWKHEKAQERYDYDYSERELREWIPRIKKLQDMTTKLYLFFNNHPGGKATQNAKMMKSLLDKSS